MTPNLMMHLICQQTCLLAHKTQSLPSVCALLSMGNGSALTTVFSLVLWGSIERATRRRRRVVYPQGNDPGGTERGCRLVTCSPCGRCRSVAERICDELVEANLVLGGELGLVGCRRWLVEHPPETARWLGCPQGEQDSLYTTGVHPPE